MRVILLLGPSSAGKSTLCKELEKIPHWKILGDDAIRDFIRAERIATLKPEMLDVLNKHGFLDKLKPYISSDRLLTLCTTGILTISHGNHPIAHQSFPNPGLPGLEKVLKDAGFSNEQQIIELAKNLRFVAQLGNDVNKKHPYPDLIETLYDKAFDIKHEQEATIILDVVPPPKDEIKEFLNHFAKRAEKFRDKFPNMPLETATVFAYCAPLKLSERIKQRNEDAKEYNNPADRREGTFPFEQLGGVITTTSKNNDTPSLLGELSGAQLLLIAIAHIIQSSNAQNYLTDLIDPNAFTSPTAVKPNVVETKTEAVKLRSDDDLIQPDHSTKANYSTKEIAERFSRLTNVFGIYGSDSKEKIPLAIRQGLKFDIFLDMGKRDAKSLVQELLDNLKSEKQSHNELKR